MAGTTLDIENLLGADGLAKEISRYYREWAVYRDEKVKDWKEVRNYVYAVDTSTTSNSTLPWSNTTTTPKLTQIADNLHANYFASLFPAKKWLRWEAGDKSTATIKKKQVIEAFMENKIQQSGLVNTCSKLLWDYILYGNCFGKVEFVNKTVIKEDFTKSASYAGPILRRISPYDIVFNPTSPSFEEAPKIIRSIVTVGELKKQITQSNHNEGLSVAYKKSVDNRMHCSSYAAFEKADAYIADGFSSIQSYYGSNYVEILTFYGDIFDRASGELKTNRIISVLDRAYIISDIENPSWLDTPPIFHAGWRDRPDNLYSMGPLDNLVGLQYRIDHLENMKADVWDQIAYPIVKIKGDVEDFEFAPAARIILGEDADVAYLYPDATALQADTQIAIIENKMEEMAGAPRQAMGIRTPGEKTAFEVQSLENSSSRIFEHKTAHFERVFLEKVINCMLETARREMDYADTVKIIDEGILLFEEITREDLIGIGSIVPVGARHFAERAKRVQQLRDLVQIKAQDPTVAPHISGLNLAKILTEELEEPSLFEENVAVLEQMKTGEIANEAQVMQQEKQQIAIEAGI